MKKTKLSLSILALLAMSGIATANSSFVNVDSSHSEFAQATGTYTQAANAGSAFGNATLFGHNGFGVADYGTQNAGSANGFGSSITEGVGGGGLNITLSRHSIDASSGSGQAQTAANGNYYPYAYDSYFGGNTSAQGSGFSDVAGGTWHNPDASFSASSQNAQAAQSGGWWYGWGAPSSTQGSSQTQGHIDWSAQQHHYNYGS